MARPKLETPTFKLVQRGAKYYVRWWQDTTWHSVSTRTEDRTAARRFLADFAAGHGTPEPPESATISSILDGYLADRKPRVRSYATLEAACAAIRRHLGDMEPGSLTRERARLYASQRKAEGHWVGPAAARVRKPTAPGTIIREIVTLRAALKWGLQERWITALPYVPSLPSPPPRDRWLTRAEFDSLVDAATGHVKLFILLALHTGARSGALMELTWDAVSLDRRTITLGAGAGNKGRATVPINDDLLAALREARRSATCPSVIERGGEPIASVKKGFASACARAGLKGVTPHTLRHTAPTWMAMDGVPMAQISRYLGHASEKVTERVYAKHTPEYLRDAANSLTRKTGTNAPVNPSNYA